MLPLLILQLHVFQSPVTQTYDKRDATFEILLMLIGAFILGFLFRHFLGYMSKKEIIVERNFDSNSSNESDLIQPAAKSNVIAESRQIEATEVNLKSEKSTGLNPKLKTKGRPKDQKTKTTKTEKKATKTKAERKVKTERKVKKTTPKVKDESNVSQAKKTAPKIKSATKTVAKKKDDLKIIEGIGSKIEGLLLAKKITNFDALAKSPIADLEKILTQAGPRYKMHKPETWAEQAILLRDGKTEEFKKLTDDLKGGRRKK